MSRQQNRSQHDASASKTVVKDSNQTSNTRL
jgi:hypothetical protein